MSDATTENEPAPETELLELSRALRAQLERFADAGADGLPRAPVSPAQPATAQKPAPERTATRDAAPGPSASAPSRDARVPTGAPARVEVSSATASASAPPLAPGVTPEPPADFAERTRRLEVLGEHVKSCTLCALHQGRTQTVFARGTGSSGLCFVGEGPGADEDAQGYPFVGAAGQLLDRMIAAMGFGRDEVYVCNIVKCRPPKNRKPEPDEMAACRPYLAEQIEILAPQVMVALGATAVEGLLGVGGGITRLRGSWRLYKGTIPVMPTFHPAYLLRTPAAKREVWDDLQAVVKHMGRELPARK